MIEQLAVVIPVGPDDRATPLLRQLGRALPGAEVIGSATRPAMPEETDAARRGGLTWVVGPAGRAAQLNRGAAAARAAWFWFLHADTTLPDPVTPALEAFTAESAHQNAIGYFRLAFAGDGPRATRLNAAGANFRSRWLGLPFGDQGFLVRRPVWDRLGGFDDRIGPGEDLDWVVRARAAGVPLVALPAVLTTSARRYRDAGWLRTTWRHAWLTVGLYRSARARLRSE